MHPTAARGRDGRLPIFLARASLALILLMMIILAGLILVNCVDALWPAPVERVVLRDGAAFLGVRMGRDVSPEGRTRLQYKVGNRELHGGADFRWVAEEDIASRDIPEEAAVVSRTENGDFYGFLVSVDGAGGGAGETTPDGFSRILADSGRRWESEAEPLRARLASLGDRWQALHLAALKAEWQSGRAAGEAEAARWDRRLAELRAEERETRERSEATLGDLNRVRERFASETARFATAEGREVVMPLTAVVDALWPNRLGVAGKTARFLTGVWNLLSRYPREANTEGGLFPALFGTVMLVFIMAISAFPLGVAAGVYLREYARDGFLARTARVAVNNLAGVPSIVYGIFGLGFFIYGLGGGIDRLLFPERVAAGISTYGGGGIIWSSLTLGLLTLPVVIVATEEALATVPSEVRQGSLALGATRFQTLWRVVLPMASPGILTGFILAMARAAGEVAPLMLTGAVKSAHSLPLDGTWPFVHLERKFMHLGFHIYDMGFQSPNVEAAKPMVYLTAMVLLVLVFALNIAAIRLRKRMHEKYAMRGF